MVVEDRAPRCNALHDDGRNTTLAAVWVNPLAEVLDDDEPPPTGGWVALLGGIEARRPAWQRDALCTEYPDVSWFIERGQSAEPAKAVCQRCLVAQECAAYADELGVRHGIWAGKSAERRRRR